ncbi:MAG: sulfite exporter TauE/SafE family protein [Alphaproteobacteria bacterium]|nr:sulfite exporter TauE/SafE family protein [Alphaproteobacteria bacterium]
MIAQCIHDITLTHGLVISLFLAGLVGGVSHCAGMCAPFVLAQVSGAAPKMERLSSALLLPYHFGRMTTYVSLAVLVHSVINLAFVFSGAKALIAAPLLMLAGVIFLVSAFPNLSALFPWTGRIGWAAPYRFFARFPAGLSGDINALKRYGLGVLLGFMPCGLVVSALLAAATAPNVWQAALAMSVFTFGTMPALFLVAFGGQELKYRYPNFARRFSQGAMVISSLWLFALAGSMIF